MRDHRYETGSSCSASSQRQTAQERRAVSSSTTSRGCARCSMRLMQSDGFTCFEAGSGVEALALLAREPVTLVLSDLRMPKMDGIELLREVRDAVAGHRGRHDHRGGGRRGRRELPRPSARWTTSRKPFHLEEVRARVTQALEKRRLVLENRGPSASLEERVAVQARRLEELFLASIQSLADALEVKDSYTRGHSVRVSHYSGRDRARAGPRRRHRPPDRARRPSCTTSARSACARTC